MSKQYPGGIISKTPPVPTQAAASGVWTLDQQAYWQKLGQWPAPPYQISRSLRFNRSDQAYLERTPSTSGNQKTWTQSLWVKRSSLSTQQDLYSPYYGGNGSDESQAYFNSSDQLAIYDSGASAGYMSYVTTQVFRDVSAWYHIVFACDTTQATASDRLKIYVNGVQITSFTSSQTQTQNTNTGWNGTSLQRIGSYARTTNATLDGYMTEFYNIDGQALTPSSFGFTDPSTGVWTPYVYTGTYGTNGFYLNFSDNSNTTAATLGKDYSGNGNNWTPNNFSVTAGAGNDSFVDSPTSYGTDTGVGGTVRGNYCTMNPLNQGTNASSSNGNLTFSCGTNSAITGTFGITSGKWYWEVQNPTAKCVIGIVNSSATLNTYIGVNVNGWGYYGANGQKFNNGGSAYGATFTTTDVIGVAFDADAGTLVFYKNNTSQGTAFTGLTSGPYFVAVSDDTTGGATGDFNFGQRLFSYTAPSGFKALCTQNLPTPTIGATTATQAGKFFNPVLYTGNASTNAITGVGFQPDFVWMKNRTSAFYHGLYDAVRGTGTSKSLYSNTTEAEGTNSANQNLVSFDSNGFTLGSTSSTNVINTNGEAHVSWNWKANGSGSTNTAGSITSTVSANTTSGFSVVTYTGNSTTSASVGHGLGVAPSMILFKRRDTTAQDWGVYHSAIPRKLLQLNTANSLWNGGSDYWYSAPSSSVIYPDASGIGDHYQNISGANYVAYCFAPIAGYSAFGSYTGNGSTDGPFVFTGMRPAFILIKSTSATGYWLILDVARNTYNAMTAQLWPNGTDAENNSYGVLDAVSNGFKLRNVAAGYNDSATVYIYMAFASNPFKYSLAR